MYPDSSLDIVAAKTAQQITINKDDGDISAWQMVFNLIQWHHSAASIKATLTVWSRLPDTISLSTQQ